MYLRLYCDFKIINFFMKFWTKIIFSFICFLFFNSAYAVDCSVKISKCDDFNIDWGTSWCYMWSLDQWSSFNIKWWVSDSSMTRKIRIWSQYVTPSLNSWTIIWVNWCSYDWSNISCSGTKSDWTYPQIVLEWYKADKLAVTCTFNDWLIHSTNFNMNLSPFAITKKVNNTWTMESNVKLVFSFIFKWFYTIFWFLAWIIILVWWIMMITSFGNQEKFNKGKNAITYTAIALAVSILAYPIIMLIQWLLK